jgi:hypothetical protein
MVVQAVSPALQVPLETPVREASVAQAVRMAQLVSEASRGLLGPVVRQEPQAQAGSLAQAVLRVSLAQAVLAVPPETPVSAGTVALVALVVLAVTPEPQAQGASAVRREHRSSPAVPRVLAPPPVMEATEATEARTEK